MAEQERSNLVNKLAHEHTAGAVNWVREQVALAGVDFAEQPAVGDMVAEITDLFDQYSHEMADDYMRKIEMEYHTLYLDRIAALESELKELKIEHDQRQHSYVNLKKCNDTMNSINDLLNELERASVKKSQPTKNEVRIGEAEESEKSDKKLNLEGTLFARIWPQLC